MPNKKVLKKEHYVGKKSLYDIHVLADKLTETQRAMSEWFERAPALAAIITKTKLQNVNRRWEKITGWSIKELLRMPWQELIHPDDMEPVLLEMKNLDTLPDTGHVSFISRFKCKNGEYRWLSWAVSSWNDRGESFCVVRDMADLPIYEKLLARLTKERLQGDSEIE